MINAAFMGREPYALFGMVWFMLGQAHCKVVATEVIDIGFLLRPMYIFFRRLYLK